MTKLVVATAELVLATLALGCLVPQTSIPDADAAMAAPADKAVIVLFMSTGERQTTDVIDETTQCLAFVGGYELFPATVQPGRHEIIALGSPGHGRGMVVEVAAGKTYFLQAEPEKPGGELALVPIRPHTAEWLDLDNRLRETQPYQVDKRGCADYLADARPGWEKILATTSVGLANAPPSLTPDDGVTWRGSAARSRP